MSPGYSGIAILFAVAAVVSVLFKKLKQPLILGYILAGVLTSPFLSDKFDSSIISLISDLGITLLAFTMGMELSLKGLRELGHRIIFAGLAQLMIMLPLGYFVGVALGWPNMTSIFFASAFSLASTTVVMKTMRDSRESLRSYSDTLIGLLITEDMLTVFMLAILSALGSRHAIVPLQILMLVGSIAIFAVVSLILAISILPKAINKISEMGNDEILMIVSLGFCFALSLFAQELGFSFVIGAFIVGVAVAESEHKERLQQKMAPVRDIFLAVFFVSIGTLIELQYVVQLLPYAIILGGLFVLWKFVSVSVGFTALGFQPKTAVYVGIAAGAMGEFSFVIGRLGLQYGFFSLQIYTLIVLISAATIVILPQFIKRNDSIYGFLQARMPGGVLLYSIAARRVAHQLKNQYSRPRKMKSSSKNLVLTLLLNATIVVAILVLTIFFVENSGTLVTNLKLEYGRDSYLIFFGLLYLGFISSVILLMYASFNTVLAEADKFFNKRDVKSAFTVKLFGRMLQAIYVAIGIAMVVSTLQPLLYLEPTIGLSAAASVAAIVLILWRGLSDLTLSVPSMTSEKQEAAARSESENKSELIKG